MLLKAIKKGYTILKRNYRFGRSEIDIIARKDDVLAIVQVKSRTSTYFGGPQPYVSKKQQRSLIVAADHFVSKITWMSMLGLIS